MPGRGGRLQAPGGCRPWATWPRAAALPGLWQAWGWGPGRGMGAGRSWRQRGDTGMLRASTAHSGGSSDPALFFCFEPVL